MKDRSNPWKNLARIIGPLMIWLSLSFIIIYILLGNDWILASLNENPPQDSTGLILGAALSGAIGVVLTVWGFSGKPMDFVPARIPAGKNLCPGCWADLLKTTGICPYCGTDIVEMKKRPKP